MRRRNGRRRKGWNCRECWALPCEAPRFDFGANGENCSRVAQQFFKARFDPVEAFGQLAQVRIDRVEPRGFVVGRDGQAARLARGENRRQRRDPLLSGREGTARRSGRGRGGVGPL